MRSAYPGDGGTAHLNKGTPQTGDKLELDAEVLITQKPSHSQLDRISGRIVSVPSGKYTRPGDTMEFYDEATLSLLAVNRTPSYQV